MIVALKIIGLIIVSYLIGNINNALIISKLKKRDVRKMGSGNPGSMNMFRNFGVKLGLLTLMLDALKGAIPCLLGWWLLGEPYKLGLDRLGLYIGALSVIVGHIFPVFLKFKGGKGIASSIGICLIANPIVTLIAFAVGSAFIVITKMGSITSFIIISIPLALEGFRIASSGGGVVEAILVFTIFGMTLFAHRKNVVKLFSGSESKTVLFGKKKSAKAQEKL